MFIVPETKMWGLHHIDEVAVVEIVLVELLSMVHNYRKNIPEAEEKVLSKKIIVLPLPEGNSLNKKSDAKDWVFK